MLEFENNNDYQRAADMLRAADFSEQPIQRKATRPHGHSRHAGQRRAADSSRDGRADAAERT